MADPIRRARICAFFRQMLDHPVIILPRDFTLFLRGARTDAAIKRTQSEHGSRAAFETAYTRSQDPWGSAAPRYRYQRRKYEQIMALLPNRRFVAALDVGCGLGLLSQHLATRSDSVLGIDVATAALEHARTRAVGIVNLKFAQGDILDLPTGLNGLFDLLVVADTLYYLSPFTDEILKSLCTRLADLLVPGGVCVLANHFFFGGDADSKLSRRIHNAFTWSNSFIVVSQHRKAFFLVTILSRRDTGTALAAPAATLGPPYARQASRMPSKPV